MSLFPVYTNDPIATYITATSPPVATLGLFPPNTGSLGGTMTAGTEYERTSQTLADPTTGNPIRVDRIWPEGSGPGTVPVTEAYNQDGTLYQGSVAALILPTGGTAGVANIYQENLNIVTQNVIPPLSKPWKSGAGSFANILVAGRTFTNGNVDGVVTFTNGSTTVTFNASKAGFNLNPGDSAVAQYSF